MYNSFKKGLSLTLVALLVVLVWFPATAHANSIDFDDLLRPNKVEAKIIEQPVDVSAPTGETAVVTFTAEGDELTYKWYYKDKNSTKFALTNTFKSNTYSAVMGTLRDGRQVYCVITDKYGNSVQTNTVTLSKTADPLKITKQPESVSVAMGETATVTFTAEGSGLTYQWYYKNKGASTFTLTTTFKSNTYYTPMTAARAGRQIYCVVTDADGNSVQTDTVTLNIISDTKVEITKQPENATAPVGQEAVVTFEAKGEGLTYKWYYKDKTATKFTLTNTFKSNTYSAVMGNLRDGRQVYCVVTDENGNSVQTNTVTLSIEASALKITQQPKSVSVAMGETATVTFAAEGSGLTYKWYYKNKGASTFTLTTTFKSNTYYTPMTTARDGRQIYCVVTDANGNSVQTDTVTLSIATSASITITQQPVDVSAPSGESAVVTVIAEGEGLTYKWYYKDKTATKFTLTNTFKGNTYSAVMGNLRTGRQVYCVITDQYGNSVQTNTVTLTMS